MTAVDTKTFIFVTQSQDEAPLKEDKLLRAGFLTLFPYFKKSRLKKFAYNLNIIYNPDDKMWMCTFTIFSQNDKYYEPQLLAGVYTSEQMDKVAEFYLFPLIFFQHAEKYALLYYDNLNGQTIEKIIDTWIQTIPI